MTIEQAGAQLRARKISCVELVKEAAGIIEKQNSRLNAFITLTVESALADAAMLDAELAAGKDRGPMHGIPIAHKDLFFTKGVRTTSGSKLFENFVPDSDAPVVAKMSAAGCISLGKLNLHELAYGVTSTNPHFGAVRNPWNAECIPGGSSGGSGAAVATGMVFVGTGTDTGGSIRIPASYCGVAGHKPSYGLVDRTGIQPLGYTLDHIGPLTRTVRDAEIATEVMSGAPLPGPSIAKPRIGVPENFYFDLCDPEVTAAVQATAKRAEALGCAIVPVRVPDIDALNMVGFTTLLPEASAVYEEAVRKNEALFGADVLERLKNGLAIRAADYVAAQIRREKFAEEFRKLFTTIDILLTPTIPITAPKIGQTSVEHNGVKLETRVATTRFVRAFNVLGLPALSIPVGMSKAGLPIGAQLVGRLHEDRVVIDAGKSLELVTKFS